MSCGEDQGDVVMLSRRSHSSRGVQVSPPRDAVSHSPPARMSRKPSDSCCHRANTSHAEAGQGSPLAAPGSRGGREGGGRGRTLWRWPYRRGDAVTTVSSSSASSASIQEQRSSSPFARRLRRRGSGGNMTPAPLTTSAAASLPQQLVQVRRRSTYPPNDDRLGAEAPGGDNPSLRPAFCAAAAAPAGPESLPVSPGSACLSSIEPERLVASMLLHHSERGATFCAGERGEFVEPVSPTTSASSDSAPGWAERAGLTGGESCGRGTRSRPQAPSRLRAPFTAENNTSNAPGAALGAMECLTGRRQKADRDLPRFLRPVLLLLAVSLAMILGTRVGRGIGMFGPAAHAAGGVQLPEAVVDDIFERADKDNDGVIANEEIQCLVEGAGGALLDDASEIRAGVESVIRHLDRNADHGLSRDDLLTYWKRLGTLLTVDEVAQWVVHAAQLPEEVAETFRSNSVTGYDFPELAANQGALLEQDLGVTRPAFRKRLARSMKWKLWGMGSDPAAPEDLRASNTSCGAVTLEWNQSEAESTLSFPVHTFVLRRAPLGLEAGKVGKWTSVMEGLQRAFFDAQVKPGAAYRYSLQAWNALGHSCSVEIDVFVSKDNCVAGGFWSWLWIQGNGSRESASGGVVVALVTAVMSALWFKALGRDKGRRPSASTKRERNGHRIRQRPEPSYAVVTGTSFSDGESERRGARSPASVTSGSGRIRRDPVAKTWSPNANVAPLKKSMVHGSKERLKRVASEASAAPAPASRLPHSSSMSGVGGKSRECYGRAEGASPAAVESMRREAAKRMISRRSTSREERTVCKICRKEWRWYRNKHTCCVCHDQFCGRHECGITCHSFGACPVGGSCTCSDCSRQGRRGSVDR